MSPRTPLTDFPSPKATLYSAVISGNDQGLVQERLLLAAIIEEAQEAVLSTTLDGVVTTWNSAAERLFGYTAREIIGMPSRLFIPATCLFEKEMLVDRLCRGELPASFETVRRHKEGHQLHVVLTLSPVKNALGKVVGVSTIARNAAQHRPQAETLVRSEVQWKAQRIGPEHAGRQPLTDDADRKALTTDVLTRLKNHRAFQERTRQEVDRAACYGAPLSVLLLDVDRFKSYNDQFGHLSGDSVLQKLADILTATTTADMAARYEGEMFAVLLTETDAEGARAVAEQFRTAIEAAPWPQQPVTASFGIATLALSPCSPGALIAQAEEALSRSKKRGRNCVTHAEDRPEPALMAEPSAIVLQHLEDLQAASFNVPSETLKQSLRASYDSTVESWSRLLDIRDKETEGHNKRVTSLMVRLARHVGMREEEVLFVKWGAQLHDIGKMAVPDQILHKRGPLSVEEWVEIRRHPVIAYEMLAPIEFLGPAIDIAYCHHEKWDGTGYPRSLKGTAIPRAARLFAVIDVYDALCSDRCYREGWPEHKVREYLRDQAGTHFEPQAVEAFLEMIDTDSVPGPRAESNIVMFLSGGL